MRSIQSGSYAVSTCAAPARSTFQTPVARTEPQQPYVQVSLAALGQLEEGWASVGKTSKGKGLFGSEFLSGLLGPDSPVLNLVHAFLDPIPVVGDLANQVCSVVSPGYHEAHTQDCKPASGASVALTCSASTGG